MQTLSIDFSSFASNYHGKFITTCIVGHGATHSDELPYLFHPGLLLPDLKEIGEPEMIVIKNMCSLWTNFAKTRYVCFLKSSATTC